MPTTGTGFLPLDTELAKDSGNVLDFPVANRIAAHPFESSVHSHRPLGEGQTVVQAKAAWSM